MIEIRDFQTQAKQQAPNHKRKVVPFFVVEMSLSLEKELPKPAIVFPRNILTGLSNTAHTAPLM